MTNNVEYGRMLVLYSGGADSTYLVASEPEARHLVHFESGNPSQSQLARVNALAMDRWLSIIESRMDRDGEIGQIHSLYDTQMALDASVRAAAWGLRGIVMGFNADDIGIDAEAIEHIMRRVVPDFVVAQPLRDTSAAEVRERLRSLDLPGVRWTGCMMGIDCGACPKCTRGY